MSLEKVTQWCLILVCCVSLFLLLEKRFGHQGTLRTASVPTAQALEGRELDLTGAFWGRSSKTVVVALTSQCKFCTASLPFYNRLSKLRARPGSSFSIIVISPESSDVVVKLLSGAGILADQVLSADFSKLGFRGTPSVFIVDSRGTVKRTFVGQLDGPGESGLLAELMPEPDRRAAGAD